MIFINFYCESFNNGCGWLSFEVSFSLASFYLLVFVRFVSCISQSNIKCFLQSNYLKWAELFVIPLTCSVPQSDIHWSWIHHYISRIIIKDSRDILTRESISGIVNKETSLTNCSISNHYIQQRARYLTLINIIYL